MAHLCIYKWGLGFYSCFFLKGTQRGMSQTKRHTPLSHFNVSCLLLFWMVWSMESSVAFEVILTQDDVLINFIHILWSYEIYNSALWLDISGREEGLTQNKGPVPIWAAINETSPMHSLCICNEKHLMYYLYCICKLAVSCALIGKTPLYKMYANHKWM